MKKEFDFTKKLNGTEQKETRNSFNETPEMLAMDIEGFFQVNYGLIAFAVVPYKESDEFENLLQRAYIGALKGLQTYDPSMAVKLNTYVYTCAENEVKMYLSTKFAKGHNATSVSLNTRWR